MATDQRNIISLMDTDAKFRTWGTAIAAQLVACGLVKTSDTGQINWGTVTIPAAGSVGGYEIYRFDDALQATAPIFFKIEYGRAGGSNTMMFYLTVGMGSDGAGGITGFNQFGRTNISGSNTLADGATNPSYCCGDGSRIALVTNLKSDNNFYTRAFIIDRTRDANGAATSDGFLVWTLGAGSAAVCQLVPFYGPVPATIACGPAIPMTGMQSKVGSDIALSPWQAPCGKALAVMAAVTYVHADITELASFTASFMGATRTFMPLGDGITAAAACFATSTGRSIALLWE